MIEENNGPNLKLAAVCNKLYNLTGNSGYDKLATYMAAPKDVFDLVCPVDDKTQSACVEEAMTP